jgi:uncharacterized protein YggE
MKNKVILAVGVVILVLVMGLAGCSAGGVQAAENQPVNVNIGNQQTGIWVSGEGKVTVTPDLATVNLGVSAKAATVAEAQSQAAAAMEKVMAALKANGLVDKDIQTQYYNIQQVTRWDDKTQAEVVTGYSVSNTVTAKIRDMEKVGTIIDAVAVAGGDFTRINGINFSVEKPEQYYEDARKLAMNDAKIKAEQIAELAGVTLGKATYISEGTISQPITYPSYGGYKALDSAGAAYQTAISAGETDITLNVQVAYAIQ